MTKSIHAAVLVAMSVSSGAIAAGSQPPAPSETRLPPEAEKKWAPAEAPAAAPAQVAKPSAPAAPAAAPAAAAPAPNAPIAAPVAQAAPAAGTGAAAAPVISYTQQSLTQRHSFVSNLIERSSSAKQLEKSGSPEALKIREDARAAHIQAKAAIDKGELEKADGLLKEAVRLMTQAVRMAHPEEVVAAKNKADFGTRKETVLTLIATGKRVAGEKGSSKPEFVKAEGLVKEAQALVDAGKVEEGRAKVDQAYELVKDSVRGMRAGEELRADKNFANQEEEYRYEQGRNDEYLRLVRRVVDAQEDPASWEESAKKGQELRNEADALARKKDFDGALKSITQSTNQLKSVIRRAGVPII